MGHLGYLLMWMWLCLALAALLGALFAFFLQRIFYSRKSDRLEQSWISRMRQTEQERDASLARLTTEIEEHREQIPTLENSLAERSLLIAKLEDKNSVLKQQTTELESQLRSASDGDPSEYARDTLALEQAVADAVVRAKSEAEVELKQKDAELSGLRQEMAGLRDKYSDANVKVNQAENTLRVAQNKISEDMDIVATFSKLKQDYAESLKLGKQQTVSIEQKTRLLNAAEAQIESLERRVAMLDKEAQERQHSAAQTEELLNRIGDRDARILALGKERDALNEHQRQSESQVQSLSAFEHELEERSQELGKVTNEANQWQSRYQSLKNESEEAAARIQLFDTELKEWRQKHQQLEQQSNQDRRKREALEGQLQVSRETIDELMQLSKSREQQELDLEEERQRWRSKLQETESALHVAVTEQEKLNQRLVEAQRAYQIATLEQAASAGTKSSDPVQKPAGLFDRAPSNADDLKKIRGVGPVMEKTMNDLGIYQFTQIAKFTAQDIAWISSHIGSFGGRIERDNWKEQAAGLWKEKYSK